MTPAYFADMKIVDERLTKLEKDYDKIIKLLNDMTNDLSKINGGSGGNSGIKEESNKSSKRQKSI